MQIVKQLWLSKLKTPWGLLRLWRIKDFSKACPTSVYFWDTPKRFYEEPPEYAPD